MFKTFVLLAMGAFTVSAVASTAVGHPHPTGFASGAGLTYAIGALPIDYIVYEHCDASTETVQVDDTLNPVQGDPIYVPAGTHCGATIVLSGRVLVGVSGNGGTAGLSLGVGSIDLDIDPPIVVPTDLSAGGTALILGDDDWITATTLGLSSGQHVFVGAAHPLHDTLRDSIRFDSLLY